MAAGFVACAMHSSMGYYAFTVINQPIAEEFGWSRGGVTTAFLVFQLAFASVVIIAGLLADRHGPRLVLFLGTLVMSFTLFLLSRTSALWNFVLLYGLMGAGIAFVGSVAVSINISHWFHRWRGTMQGLAFTGLGLGGFAIAPILGNYLIPTLTWRGAYLALGVILLVLMLPLLIFVVRDTPRQKGLQAYGWEEVESSDDPNTRARELSGFSLKQALASPVFWVMALTMATYGMGITATMQNQVSMAGERGFSVSEAVAAIGIIGLFSAGGKLLFGYLGDRTDPKYASALSYVFMVLSLAAMWQATSVAYLWGYAVLMGLASGGWAPNMALLTARYFGLKHYGSVLGAMQMVFLAGESISPLIAGLVFDRMGSYHPVLTVLIALNLLAIPIILLIRRPRLVSS